MNVELILFGLALLVRGGGALWGGDSSWKQLAPAKAWGPFSHILSKTAVWLGVVGIGAWSPIWPIALFALIGFGVSFWWREEKEARVVTAVTDVLLVFTASRLSLPSLAWGITIATAIFLPTAGWFIDKITEQVQKKIRWQLGAGVILLGMIVILLIPTSMRLLSSRFVYLLPVPTPIAD